MSVSETGRRALAHVGEGGLLPLWLKRAKSLLKAKGELILIHRADALGDVLDALGAGMGDLRILPVHGRGSRAAERVVVAATKGRKSPLRLLPAICLNTEEGKPSEAQERLAREGDAQSLDV